MCISTRLSSASVKTASDWEHGGADQELIPTLRRLEPAAWRIQEHCVLHCQTLLHRKKVACRQPADYKRKLLVKAKPCLVCTQKELTQTTSPFLEETETVVLTEEQPVTGTPEGRELLQQSI